MKKRTLVVIVSIFIFLITASIVGAKAKYETKPVPKGERHHISEIIHSKAKWEKVVTGEGFMEGINFDRKGNIWMVSPPTGELLTVKEDKVSVVENYKGPVGAKFHKDGRLFITDLSGEIVAYDPKTGKSETIVNSYNGKPLNGLNDLVFDESGGFTLQSQWDPVQPIQWAVSSTYQQIVRNPNCLQKILLIQMGLLFPQTVNVSIFLNSTKIEFSLSLQRMQKTSPETPFVFGQFEGGIGPDGLAVDAEGNLYVAHFQAGEIVVLDASGFKYGTIRLPEDAGTFTTNLTFHNGYLYITESSKNEVWRIKVKKEGLKLYGLQ